MAEDLDKYFKSDKSDWFVVDEKRNKNWDESLVNDFWDKIRTYKTSKNDYDFKGYVFPKFIQKFTKKGKSLNFDWNFWRKGEIARFGVDILFDDAVFLDDVFLNNVLFLKNTFFMTTKFEGKVFLTNSEFDNYISFNFSEFKGHVNFNSCIFKNGIEIQDVNFIKNVDFSGCKFSSNAIYRNTIFNEEVKWNYTEFNKSTSFYEVRFLAESQFIGTSFLGNTYFDHSEFTNCTFNKIKTAHYELLFNSIKLDEGSNLIFRNCHLGSKVEFRRCKMKEIGFLTSNIQDTRFLNCDWYIKNRIIVKNEKILKNDKINKDFNLKDIENTYRQLKKNFDYNKNWHLSGNAFVSEMVWRKAIFKNEKKWLDFFIYWLYGVFGGYTQDYKRSIKWFFLCSLLVFPLFYFVEYNFWYGDSWGCSFIDAVEFNSVNNSFEKSISASLPFLKTDLEYLSWWSKSFQTIISSILLTFFILALRKQFKQ